MCSPSARWLPFIFIALLAGCGDLPRPFEGHPGAMAERLAQPPPARLAVPVPTNALLTDAASATYQTALVTALQDAEVPAVADAARPGDWKLTISADMRGNMVVPKFTVEGPDGKRKGSAEAAPVDAGQWADGSKPILQQDAAAAAPTVTDLLTRIEAQMRMSDPNSLLNRPARVAVPDVTGAPGDGNFQLARQLRMQLSQLGEAVQNSTQNADYTVQGAVTAAPAAGGAERIEIAWTVTDAKGREAGRIVQLNDVTRGSLDRYWGDTALIVAQQAAGGVRQVILNQLGVKTSATAGPAAAATPAAASTATAPAIGK